MKNQLLLVCFFLLTVLSCTESSSINPQEIDKDQILQSTEYLEFKSTYQEYNDFKLNEIQKIMLEKKTGKMSKAQYDVKIDAYIEKCVEHASKVWDKTVLLREKYPNIDEHFSAMELIDKAIE